MADSSSPFTFPFPLFNPPLRSYLYHGTLFASSPRLHSSRFVLALSVGRSASDSILTETLRLPACSTVRQMCLPLCSVPPRRQVPTKSPIFRLFAGLSTFSFRLFHSQLDPCANLTRAEQHISHLTAATDNPGPSHCPQRALVHEGDSRASLNLLSTSQRHCRYSVLPFEASVRPVALLVTQQPDRPKHLQHRSARSNRSCPHRCISIRPGASRDIQRVSGPYCTKWTS